MKFSLPGLLAGVVTAALLVSCGGGDGDPVQSTHPQAVSIVSPAPEVTPFFIRDLPSNVVQEPPQRSDSWSYAVRHQGADIVSVPLPQTAASVSKTGMELTESVPLMGNGRGAFFRSSRDQFESFIDTSSMPHQLVRGGGPHSAIAYDFKSQPQVVGTTLAVDLAVPSFESVGDGVAQVSLFGYMTDGTHIVAFVLGIFDNRAAQHEPAAMSDTYVSFVSQAVDGTRYAEPLTASTMTSTPYPEHRTYGATFTIESLQNIIHDLNTYNQSNGLQPISANPSDYRFVLVGVLHEVALHGKPDNVVRSGMSFRNFKAYQFH